MTRSLLPRWQFSSLPALALWALMPAALSQAQEPESAVRTGDGLLSIAAALPPEVRVGEQFTYEVVVQNTSDNVVLHNIKLRQQEKSGLMIESVSVQGQDNQQQEDQQQEDQQKQKEQNSQSQGKKRQLMIDKLEPGESRTIRVTASTNSEGTVNACLIIESYNPAICLTTKAVKPELRIVKTAPVEVDQCDVIKLIYTVENAGTGTVGEFQIIDELGEGLRTIEGENKLAFTVDELEAGDTRRFVASVFATKTGEFKSRAVAKAKDSDLKSRSQNVGPKVVGADLRVSLTSDDTVYGNRPVVFTATVTNSGNARAEDVLVNLRWPEQANLRRLSEFELISQGQQSSGGQSQGSKSSQKKPEDQKKSQSGEPAGEQTAMSAEQFTVEGLDPGQSVQFRYVIGAGGLQRIRSEVEALYVCAVPGTDAEQAQVRKATQAVAVVNVVQLPALQIYVIDDEDPVVADGAVTYTIRVRNEGDAPDQQVQVTATLPNNLKFESADGPTEFKQEAQQIVFEPIETLEPGDVAEYTVTALAQGEGGVVMTAELDSESLDATVKSEEPTQLVTSENTD